MQAFTCLIIAAIVGCAYGRAIEAPTKTPVVYAFGVAICDGGNADCQIPDNLLMKLFSNWPTSQEPTEGTTESTTKTTSEPTTTGSSSTATDPTTKPTTESTPTDPTNTPTAPTPAPTTADPTATPTAPTPAPTAPTLGPDVPWIPIKFGF